MNSPYVAVRTFDHQIECFCPHGCHSEVVTIHKGDRIEITPERKYNDINGWYVYIIINEQASFYMAVDDLEWYFSKEKMISMIDLDLRRNYLQYKINQALDERKESEFLKLTTEYKRYQHI